MRSPVIAALAAALLAAAAGSACADPDPEPEPGTRLTDIQGGPVDEGFVAECDAALAPSQVDPEDPRRVAVIGAIADVMEAERLGDATLLEFAGDAGLAVAIFEADRDRHPDDLEAAYQGRTVCVRGVVRTALDRPVIVAATSEDIAILSDDDAQDAGDTPDPR